VPTLTTGARRRTLRPPGNATNDAPEDEMTKITDKARKTLPEREFAFPKQRKEPL